MLKKLFIILTVFFGLGLWFLWYLGGRELSLAPPAPKPDATMLAAVAVEAKPAKRRVADRDHDQIPDWEESLRGTDAQQPNKENNNDPNQSALTIVRRALAKKQAPLIAADNFAVDWLGPVYQLTDLRLAEDDSDEIALTDYARSLARILSVFNQPGLGYESALTLQLVEGGDLTAIRPVAEATARYRTVIGQLLALSVPESAGLLHLNLINGLARLQHDSMLMEQVGSEPTLALGGVNLAPGHLRTALAAIYNLNLFLVGQNLTLAEDETAKISLGL